MRGCTSSLLRGRRFHCREWALEKVKRYLEARNPAKGLPDSFHPPSGVLVMGGPGTGKTAFCTEMVWPQSDKGKASGLASHCLAWHYCKQEDADSMEVWRFVLGLVEQLRTSPLLAPNYSNLLTNPAVATSLEPLHCQRDPDNTFKRAVLETLLSLPSPSQSVYIVVDSLDSGCGGTVGVGESLTTGTIGSQSTSIVELLHRHHQYLPPWVLLICSVRSQNKCVRKMFSGFRKICLDDLQKPVAVQDVQHYILRRLDQEGTLRRQLTPETADMLNLLHIKSGGCFLFLERVLDGVASGLVGLREIRDIPGTLNGLYLWLCQRLFPRKLFAHVRPLLNIILATPRPLNLEELFTAAKTRDACLLFEDFQSQMHALKALLVDGPEGSKLLFHGSFAEWLTDVKYCTQKFLCSTKDGHLSLAMSLSLSPKNLNTEEVCQLGYHLLNSGIHSGEPALLALWIIWTGVSTLGRCGTGFFDSFSQHSFPVQTPVLVQQDVLQLLMKSGVYPPTCSPDNSSSMGIHCVGKGKKIVKRALQREDSVRAFLDSGVNVNSTDPSDGRTLLTTAAHNGLADITALLLCRGADPFLTDHQRQTPLTLAARQGHVGVLQVMLDWVQDQECCTVRKLLESADSEGWTALRSASWGSHKEAVKMLLDAGAEVDGCDSDGRTALRAAAWGGHEEIMMTLLEHGAKVDSMDHEGRTPLIAAAYMGHKEAVEILLDAGAEVNLADGDGRTALLVAALCVPSAAGGRGHGEVVSLLLERGANPEHKDKDGMTPLLLACYEGHEEVVELLLEAGADVDESAGMYPSAITPLLAGASMGHAGTVNRLLFWGSAVDGIDGEGRTALCLAAAKGSVEVVRALLDRGLDENHKDDLGWTPLHAAACEGHKSICAVLTEHGSMARVSELDVEGRTPLILASQEGHCSTVRLLLDRKSPIDHRGYNGHSALGSAALQGHGEVVELLLRRGADTDVRDAEGRPLLYLLILEGGLDIAALLIEKGGVPLESRDAEGRTALHVAAWQGDLDGIELLLKNGADPNSVDSEGRPPLHSVAWRGHIGAGRLLLRGKGINIDLACKKQAATALSIAAQEGHYEIVAMLLENGAKPDLMDHYGRSPVKVAGKRGNFSIVGLLESYGAKTFPGLLPSLCKTPGSSHSSIVKNQVSIWSVEGFENGGAATSSTSSNSLSASCSPASTAERFHSVPGSQTSSSTCHSLATVQTVPADSLSFIQQIQQHSLPRCRSRPSTLPLRENPNPKPCSLQRSVTTNKQKEIFQDNLSQSPCMVLGLQDSHSPLKGLGSPQTADYILKPHNPHPIFNEPKNSPLKFGSCKWNSVIMSLGLTPNQEATIRQPVNRDSSPLGYPPLHLQSHKQKESWDDFKKTTVLPTFDLSSISPHGALLEESVFITTTDPHLNLKQAIKLQFEGPTSAALYKRETPL